MLLDSEVLDLLRYDPELLAIADTIARAELLHDEKPQRETDGIGSQRAGRGCSKARVILARKWQGEGP